MQRQHIGRVCSWGEVARQAFGQDADAMEWQERIWHWQASAEESSCKTALLEVGTI